MRAIVTIVCLIGLSGAAWAQTADHTAEPVRIGNRANGFSYQPTPNQVDGPEASAGIRPSPARQHATDQTLGRLDKNLLKSEGLPTAGVPDFGRVQ